jgi:hypothetical protein
MDITNNNDDTDIDNDYEYNYNLDSESDSESSNLYFYYEESNSEDSSQSVINQPTSNNLNEMNEENEISNVYDILSEDSLESDNNSSDSYESLESINWSQINCINFNLCKQTIFKQNTIYCKYCFLFIHKELISFTTNSASNTCPICLSNDKNDKIVKLFICNHTVCYECLFNIYWKVDNIDEIIIFPIPNIKKKWKEFMSTVLSRKLKCFVIYKLAKELKTNNCNNDNLDFNSLYNILISKINIKHIPIQFIPNLKELVFYEMNFYNHLTTTSYNKHIKRESIKNCPYCRSSKY